MSVNWSQYSLAELKQNATHTFREGGGSRPDVLLIEIEGEQAVLKDQNACDPLFGKVIGPLLNWRETKALERLSNVDCIPALLHKPDQRSFIMSYHQSEPVTRLQTINVDWPSFFIKLNDAITQIHNAGVAHNDLRNPTNTLVTPDGDPILVDLVAAFFQGQSWNISNQWVFKKFCQVDKSAITKMKQRVAPELVSENDVVAEDIAGRPGMAIKGLGQLVRKVSRKLFTK